jgi:hypothetical protein
MAEMNGVIGLRRRIAGLPGLRIVHRYFSFRAQRQEEAEDFAEQEQIVSRLVSTRNTERFGR